MKKALAALAVLVIGSFCFTAVAAENEAPAVKGNVEIYGKAKVSVDLISTDSSTTNADKGLTRVSSNSSRLGFKGKEDLGGGLSAVMQVELGITYDGSGTVTFRNSYAGLSHEALGTIIAGIHDTPYKMSTASLDVFGDTMGDYNAIIGNVNGKSDFNLRAKNTVMYLSPKWNGFRIMAQTSTTGQESETSSTTPDKQEYSASAGYSGGPLYVAAAYEVHKNGYGSLDASGKMKVSGMKAGAGYSIDGTGTSVGLVFEGLKDDTSDSANTRNALYVALKQKVGKETLKLAYGKADDGKSAAKTGATLTAVGIDHSFSKRTTVYALYARMNNDDGATYGLGQSGAGGAYAPPIAGDSPSVISVGINHNF